MMDHLKNLMRQEALLALNSRAAVKLGTISSYDPATHSVKVLLQPENQETGFIPLLSPMVGNGWGMICAPNIDDQVEVQFQEDGVGAGFVCGRLYSDSARPVVGQAGEFLLVHKQGAFIKLTADGKLSINSQVEIDITAPIVNITTTGNCTIDVEGDCDITTTGDCNIITANSTVIASAVATINAPSINLDSGSTDAVLKALITETAIEIYNSHTHDVPDVGVTDIPNQLMGDDDKTTIVKAE